MNKLKNIVLVGFNQEEINSIYVPEIGKNYYFNNIKDVKNNKGFLIIINNKDNINVVDFDKMYRKLISKFCYVWLYNKNYKNVYYKWSNIELMNENLFLVDTLNYWDMFDNYENKELEKYTQKRMQNITKLYNYLKDYKIIKTSKIVNDLNVNERMIQRYMQDINSIYHNIGYDYSLNEWYIIW